jgi:hypothetical protein
VIGNTKNADWKYQMRMKGWAGGVGSSVHGAGRSMDGLEQDAPASVPGMGMDLSYEKK